jgi:hypothetical protein
MGRAPERPLRAARNGRGGSVGHALKTFISGFSSSRAVGPMPIVKCVFNSRIAINFLELWRHPHAKLFTVISRTRGRVTYFLFCLSAAAAHKAGLINPLKSNDNYMDYLL